MILVTGATGILGRVLALYLLKNGKNVRGTKRPSSDLEEVRHSFSFYTENPDAWFSKIEWVDVDFEDQFSIQKALDGISEVYHCAAKVSFNPADRRDLCKTNIQGTTNLLYACENSSVQKFLHISSIAVLDTPNELGFLDEESEYNSKLDHSDYATSKHFSEMEVWRASAEGLQTIILNPGMIIASGNWKQSSGALIGSFAEENYTFSGGTSYVDVRDVATIAIELMDQNAFGERFILISEEKSYLEVGNEIRKLLNKNPLKVIPDGLLKFALLLNPLGFIIPKLRMINKVNIKSVTSRSQISNSKIKKKLDYQFISVKDSLAFHVENYKKDHKQSS